MFGWIKNRIEPLLALRRARLNGQLYPECRFIVALDEQRIVCRRPSGRDDSVAWEDLDAVIVEINDTGPLGTDVWWLLVRRDGKSGCTIPGGATGEKELLKALQKLPGFDNHQLIAAMSSMENRRFLCWRRQTAPS